MRLLPFSALLLLLVSTCLCAPLTNEEPLPDGEVRTTVETVVETVTRTVIHEITDPATEEPEPTTTTTPEPLPTEPAAPPRTTIETVLETVTRTVVHEVTDPTTPEPELPATDAAVEVPVHGETGLVGGANRPCPACNCNCNMNPVTACCAANGCGTASAAVAAADTTITEISGQVKQCSCADADECRKSATEGLAGCMEECDQHIKVYGDDKLAKNRACFTKGEAIITEAENCLFDKKDDYCNNSADKVNFIDHPKWDDFSAIKYKSEAHKDIKDNYLWKQHEGKYTNFQQFFHCTKHCMHNKFRECTSDKGCAVKMPTKDEFAEKMKTCTKKNVKISTAILTTCQCLAWTNGVKDLQGSCVTIGNSYFVDRA